MPGDKDGGAAIGLCCDDAVRIPFPTRSKKRERSTNTQPADAAVMVGGTATFSVTLSDPPEFGGESKGPTGTISSNSH